MDGMRPEANVNFAALLDYQATRRPHQIVAWCGDTAVTYAELAWRASRLAAGLAGRGLARGDVVGLLANNCVEFLELAFAVNRIGAVLMPINYRLAPAEVAYILDNSGAALLCTESALAELALEAVTLRPTSLVALDGGSLAGATPLQDLRSDDEVPLAHMAADELHRLMYTSGTTSHPKGVRMTHANVQWKNLSHTAEFGFTSEDVGLVCGPMYHVGAFDATVTTLLYAGGSLVIHRRFDVTALLTDIQRYRVTTVWLAPAMINRVLSDPDAPRYDLSSLRVLITGGDKTPEPLIRRIAALFPNAWFADGYGLTEGVSADTILPATHTLSKLGSVGRPCLYVELQIHDDEGNPVAAGVHGEIVTRSPKLCLGYWRDKQATTSSFRGGWFHTGDVGYLDDDGFLYLVDRLKDMIKSGGENIASLEVERVVYEHEAVSETAVVGRPDERWGEVPCAFVVLRPGHRVTADDLIAHSRARLASYKVPKEIVFVEALPRNLSGKVLKRALREMLTGDA